MKILITGNMGYVGPVVVTTLRKAYPQARLVGLDTGYFASSLTTPLPLPENDLDEQWFLDIRKVQPQQLNGFDAIIHLAAISNDPMGKMFEDVTREINLEASVCLAKYAKAAGVRTFVFASSCSVYGFADDRPRTETSELNPLTAYAISKVEMEKALARLAGPDFIVTCLRFATACGMSPRLRLDLVLNDFVANAIACKEIRILSDGTPWRPLIHVADMAKALQWATFREHSVGGAFLTINAGCDEWNFQVKELADAVSKLLTGTQVVINPNAAPDKRSYKVSFQKFKELAPNHQPEYTLMRAIEELKQGLELIQFRDGDFRGSNFIRLNLLKKWRETGKLDESLHWKR